ncbi:hypothetical protein LCGC14_1491730 [marine sediment metagenome]|uniref:Uncharacterized protein n=1 Tax=marine sediment metagenome TaxID=412755 RepID=A0A0F9M899_9ZZZZ
MATEILRPNAPGDESNIPEEVGAASPNHYQNVDEASPDEGATEISAGPEGWFRDLYQLENSTGSGLISSVSVWFRCRRDGGGYAKPCLKSGGVISEGSTRSLMASWASYAYQWIEPPEGGSWTWAKIDALQAGVVLIGFDASEYAHCTQLYVTIDYTPIAPPVVLSLRPRSLRLTVQRR